MPNISQFNSDPQQFVEQNALSLKIDITGLNKCYKVSDSPPCATPAFQHPMSYRKRLIAGDGHCHVQHSEKQLKIPYFLCNALTRVS